MKFKSLLSVLLLSASLPSVADTILGEFAPPGYVGTKAHTLTMIDAHTVCLNEAGVGYTATSVTTNSFETTYRVCMKEYTPFRTSGEGIGGDCSTQSVSWGQCGGVVNSGYQGLSSFVRNTSNTDDYEGYANFMCVDNNWVYLSGGCSKTADVCEAGLVTQWGVTSPLWADIDPDTVYTDKYGQVRHKPKVNCAAKMERAYSGDYVEQYVTSPETDLGRYNSQSNAPFRCFDGAWNREPIDGGNCGYEPKSCDAKSVTYNGCSFDIPALSHDEIYIDSTPTPFSSIGHAEAYCFDGQLEIKSQSCQLSCESNFPSRQWLPESASDAGQCMHTNFSSPSRMSPGSTRLIENEEIGMKGNVTYTCNNGTVSTTSSTCKPQPCESIPAGTWFGSDGSFCQHEAVSGFWEDGEVLFKESELDMFISTGVAKYSCAGGVMTMTESVCDNTSTVIPCVSHEINLPPQAPVTQPQDPLNPPFQDACSESFGGEYILINGACCGVIDRNGRTPRRFDVCYQIP